MLNSVTLSQIIYTNDSLGNFDQIWYFTQFWYFPNHYLF